MGDPEVMRAAKTMKWAFYCHLMERIEYLESGKEPPKEQAIPHVALALGPVALITLPFEPFSIITLRIREFSPFKYTLCAGYANGALSYFPSMDQIIRGGYEINMFKNINLFPFTEDAENHYVRGCLELLRNLDTQQ
jgi:hypothetical protein